MSRRHGPDPRSSLTHNGQIKVRVPRGLTPVFHSGTAQVPPSVTITVRGDAAGLRKTPCTTTATIASDLNPTDHPTSANAVPSSACNSTHQTSRTREGSRFRTNARAYSPDELCGSDVCGFIAPEKVRVQHRIRQLQNPLERRHFRFREPCGAAIKEGHQQSIELAHAAPAPPPQASRSSVHRTLP